MQHNVMIDDKLLKASLLAAGLTNVDDVVQLSLTMFVKLRLKKQQAIKKYKGAFMWDEHYHNSHRREDIRAVG